MLKIRLFVAIFFLLHNVSAYAQDTLSFGTVFIDFVNPLDDTICLEVNEIEIYYGMVKENLIRLPNEFNNTHNEVSLYYNGEVFSFKTNPEPYPIYYHLYYFRRFGGVFTMRKSKRPVLRY